MGRGCDARNGAKEMTRAIESRVARWYAYFQTKNTNLGKFWRVLHWKMLV
jgi:hypothetical protein